ncbi:MAG: hypothetical protein ACJAWW_001064 [Sulfurimonas sp.]|jgi:hypothetical protein
MKTMQLLTLLFVTITLSAQEVKYDSSTVEDLKDKQEVKKDKIKNSFESRFSSKESKKVDWTRKIENDDYYEKGKIKTH